MSGFGVWLFMAGITILGIIVHELARWLQGDA